MPSFAADCDEGGGGGASVCGIEVLAFTGSMLLAGTRIAVAIADPTKITTAAAAGGVLAVMAAAGAFERCLDNSGFNDWAAEVGAEFFGWADDINTGSFCPMAEGYEAGSNAWKHAMDGCSDTRY